MTPVFSSVEKKNFSSQKGLFLFFDLKYEIRKTKAENKERIPLPVKELDLKQLLKGLCHQIGITWKWYSIVV
jgi:hypothetical protein